jgi:DNA-binding transcriptional LysR family regulator
MELAQLEALLAVVEVGTFSGAAARLSVTQSALTRRIQSLEVEFGRALLVRTRPRAELTAIGQEVVAGARRIASEADLLRALARDAEAPGGPLRAAATAIGLTYLYWHTCEQFLRSHPTVDLVFQEVEAPADAARLVKVGAADVAFTALPLPRDVRGLQVVVLGTVETVIVASPRHSIAQARSVSRTQLRQVPMLVPRRRGDAAHFVNQSLFQRLGGRPVIVLETGDSEYIKRLVRLGRGVTALPWPAVEHDVRAGELALVEALRAPLVQDFGLVAPTGRMGGTARILADFCRSLDFQDLRRRRT